MFDNRDKPGPNTYSPNRAFANKNFPKYTMGKKLPGKIQSIEKAFELPSPFHYTVKTDCVLPTRHRKIGFGYGNK